MPTVRDVGFETAFITADVVIVPSDFAKSGEGEVVSAIDVEETMVKSETDIFGPQKVDLLAK